MLLLELASWLNFFFLIFINKSRHTLFSQWSNECVFRWGGKSAQHCHRWNLGRLGQPETQGGGVLCRQTFRDHRVQFGLLWFILFFPETAEMWGDRGRGWLGVGYWNMQLVVLASALLPQQTDWGSLPLTWLDVCLCYCLAPHPSGAVLLAGA